MTEYSFQISCPDEEHLEALQQHFDEYKQARDEVSRMVLGHSIQEEGWILFDDMLLAEYRRMMKLIQVLEERAG